MWVATGGCPPTDCSASNSAVVVAPALTAAAAVAVAAVAVAPAMVPPPVAPFPPPMPAVFPESHCFPFESMRDHATPSSGAYRIRVPRL